MNMLIFALLSAGLRFAWPAAFAFLDFIEGVERVEKFGDYRLYAVPGNPGSHIGAGLPGFSDDVRNGKAFNGHTSISETFYKNVMFFCYFY